MNVGNQCHILNGTREWIVAGFAVIKSINIDGTMDIQTFDGLCRTVPTDFVLGIEYLNPCRYCSVACNSLCHDNGEGETTLVHLNNLSLMSIDRKGDIFDWIEMKT